MSDAVMGRHEPDRRRILTCIGVALVLHVALIVLLSVLARLSASTTTLPPVTLDLQLESGPVLAEAPGPTSSAPAAPAARTSTAPAAPAAAPSGSGGGGFVIPTPAGTSPDAAAPVPSGPAFQVSGGKTGVGQSLPATPNTLSQPNVVVGQQGKGGAGAAAGTSAGQVQRGGEGVLVTGQTGKGSSGNLDLSRLDKAIAGSGTGGGAGAAKGSAGSGQSGSGSGSGGTGTGVDGGTGTGSGGYSVVWDQPEASKGRKLVSAAKPKLPPWVSAQGLSLSVTVSFTLTADGVVKGVKVSPSSGYADVDNAIADAIRNWRFTTAKGAPDIKGVIPYLIKAQ